MRFLASVKVRLFLTCWIVFTLHFATNVVREHYPAFALIERGDWVCDRYAHFHADLFEHTDGHWYTGNNVLGSVIAVPPLLVFDPLLDRLEELRLEQIAREGEPEVVYDTEYPNRQAMFARVKRAGLDLRFGAATAITSAFLMAPLSALLVLLMHHLLLQRGVARGRATWLALLFGLGTPVFYRTGHLVHNMFLMQVLFCAYVLLWVRPGGTFPVSLGRRVAAGALTGAAFALDYAGAVPCAALYAYLVWERRRSAGWATALRESAPFVAAALWGPLFLMATQWAMYGDPFAPGQFVMPAVNYTEEGVRGISWPTVEVFFKNLVSPGWGLFTFGPLLLFALWPIRRYREEELVVPRRERRFHWVFTLSFMLFCAANAYSLMQFNTGFRYLLPVVPFLFLLASDHLARLRPRTLAVVSALAVFHTWVLSMYRVVRDTEKELRDLAVRTGVSETDLPGYWRTLLTETAVPLSYEQLVTQGPRLPWLTVLSQTDPQAARVLGGPLVPLGLLALAGALIAWIWIAGARAERARGPRRAARPSIPAAASRG